MMNLELAEQMVALMGEYPVSEMAAQSDGRRVSVRRSAVFAPPLLRPAEMGAAQANSLPAAVAADTEAREDAQTLTAAMVGIFHHLEPPIPYAAAIQTGQVVGYIESMKLMNDVVAEQDGRLVDILIEDGAPVEYGQALFRLGA